MYKRVFLICPKNTYYVKLQEAYASESNAIGGWTLIGFQAPGSSGTTTTDTEDAWKAAANVALNDSPSDSAWDIEAKMNAAKGTVSFE